MATIGGYVGLLQSLGMQQQYLNNQGASIGWVYDTATRTALNQNVYSMYSKNETGKDFATMPKVATANFLDELRSEIDDWHGNILCFI